VFYDDVKFISIAACACP